MATDLGPPARTRADRRFAVSQLPHRPSLEHLRKQAKTRKRERGITLIQAQHELAREYGFDSWPRLVHHVQWSGLQGIERVLVLADPAAVSEHLRAEPNAAATPIGELPPLLVLLRRSTGSARDVRECARRLLDAGADPNSHTVEWGGEGQMTALFDAVERRSRNQHRPAASSKSSRGVAVDAQRCLHHAIARGRGVGIIAMLLDAGADPNLPWDRWDVG